MRLPFDRTYEGLKPFPRGQAGAERGPFDRTYEGLKRLCLPLGKPLEQTFDRTYEGLKPGLRLRRGGHVPGF